jgi:hypothetical protein
MSANENSDRPIIIPDASQAFLTRQALKEDIVFVNKRPTLKNVSLRPDDARNKGSKRDVFPSQCRTSSVVFVAQIRQKVACPILDPMRVL